MDTCKKKTSNIQNTHPIGHSELSSESHLVDMMKLKKKKQKKYFVVDKEKISASKFILQKVTIIVN